MSSLLWAFMILAVAGTIAARLNDTLARKKDLVSVERQRDGIERTLQTALSTATTLLRSGAQCQSGMSSDCAWIQPSRHVCRPEGRVSDGFVRGWWQWYDGRGTGERDVRLELAKAPPQGGPWKPDLGKPRQSLAIFLPYVGAQQGADAWADLMTDGVPRVGAGSLALAERRRELCIQRIWSNLQNLTETAIAEEYKKCAALHATALRLVGRSATDPDDDDGLVDVRIAFEKPVCAEGRVVAFDVAAEVARMPTSIFQSRKGALKTRLKAQVPVEAPASSVRCDIVGPAAVVADASLRATASFAVTVSGASTGVEVDGSVVYLDRGLSDPTEVVWSGTKSLQFSTVDGTATLTADVYDAAMRRASSCSIKVTASNVVPDAPTCNLTVHTHGCCAFTSFGASGLYYESFPPEFLKCDVPAGETVTLVGRIAGPGGSSVCQASYTAPVCSTSVDYTTMPPLATVIAAVSPAVEPPTAPPPPPSFDVLAVLRYGTDEYGRRYRVERVRERQGHSERIFERTIYI